MKVDLILSEGSMPAFMCLKEKHDAIRFVTKDNINDIDVNDYKDNDVIVVVIFTIDVASSKKYMTAIESILKIESQNVYGISMDDDLYINIKSNQLIIDQCNNPKSAVDSIDNIINSISSEKSKKYIKIISKLRELYKEHSRIINFSNFIDFDFTFVNSQHTLESLFIPLDLTPYRTDTKQWRNRDAVSAVTLFNHINKIMVSGEGGSGKSTTIRWLLSLYLGRDVPYKNSVQEKKIPLLLRCRDLENKDQVSSLENICRFCLTFGDDSEFCDLFFESINEVDEPLILLIDGLDEINSEAIKQSLLDSICKELKEASELSVVLTSREYSFKENYLLYQYDFLRFDINKVSNEQKCLFIESLSEKYTSISGKNVDIDEIKRTILTDELEIVTSSPLLLTIVVLMFLQNPQRPDRAIDIYSQAVDVLLNWRNMLSHDLHKREVFPQLGYISYEMCLAGDYVFEEDRFIQLLSEFRNAFPNVRVVNKHDEVQFFELLRKHSGIIKSAGNSERSLESRYEFAHDVFKEFFAAHAMVSGLYKKRDPITLPEEVRRIVKKTRRDDRFHECKEHVLIEPWHNVISMVMSLVKDDELNEILRCLVDDGDINSLRARSSLAAQSLLDEPNIDYDLALASIRMFVSQINMNDSDESIETKHQSISKTLSVSSWSQDFRRILIDEYCKRNLEHKKYIARIFARIARLLVQESRKIINEWFDLQAYNFKSGDKYVKIHSALGIMTLAYNKKAIVRRDIIDLLFCLLDDDIDSAYASLLTLRWLCQRQSKMDNESWIPSDVEMATLQNIYTNTQHEVIKEIIIEIGAHGDSAIYKMIVKDALTSGSNELIALAISIITDHNDSSYLKYLLKFADSDNATLQKRAFWALKVGCYDLNATQIDSLVSSENELTRIETVMLIASTTKGDYLHKLTSNFKTLEPAMKRAVVQALGASKDEIFLPILLQCLLDEDDRIASCAAYALGQFHFNEIGMYLRRILNNSNGEVNRYPLKVLGHINTEKSIEMLKSYLNYPNSTVRRYAVEALSQTCTSFFHRILLSENCNSKFPFIDPCEPIDLDRINFVAEKGGYDHYLVKDLYHEIAAEYNLITDFEV